MSFSQLRTKLSRLSLTAITNAATNIAATSADGNGVLYDAGNSTITERGFVYGTSVNPTTADNKVSSGTATGSYTISMTGLSANTVYFYRAYAIDQIGTVYGDNQTFTSASAGGSSIKTWNGLAFASVKTWNGLANASIKTYNGIANS